MPELAYSSNGNKSVERIMPQDIDAEKAVLAAMMLGQDEEILDDALMKLSPKDFYRPAHQKIFQAILELSNRNIPVDQLSLADRLSAAGDLDAIGGKPYLIELGNNSFALANWAHHIEIIKRNAILRELIGASVRITALGYDAPDDLDEVVEQAEKLLLDVTNRRVSTNFRDMKSLVIQTYDKLRELAQTQNPYNGVRTGFQDLDNLFGGLRGGDLIILAARPGIGKTALALNIAYRAATLGTAVAFYSLEMPAEQLVQRIMALETRINSKKLQTGQNLSANDWVNLAQASNRLSQLNFVVDDTASASILEVRAKARRQFRGVEPGKGLIVVDYLQLMQPQSKRTESRQVEIAEISRGLKILAKELDVPIIALSQLSRAVESRVGKRPVLSDLRESGAIEQDADIVMFLDRSQSPQEAEETGRPPLNTADVIVAKHRNGEQGTIRLYYQTEFTRFDSFSPSDDRV